MTDEELTLLHIRQAVDGLPAAQRQAVYRAAQQLRDVVAASGDFGKLALALVGAEETAA